MAAWLQRRQRVWPVFELGLRALVLVVVFVHPHAFYTYDPETFWRRAQDLSVHHLPYRDYLWEFPPLTALTLVPAPVVSMRTFVGVFVALMIAAEYLSLVLLRRGRPHDALGITAYWTIVGLPLAAFTWFRLDFLSVLFATPALLAVVRVRPAAAAVTGGVAAKLWPGTIALGRVLQRRWHGLLISVGSVAVLVGGWFAFSPSGFRAFLRYRRGSGFQVESTIGAVRMLGHARVDTVSDTFVTDAERFGFADTAFVGAWLALAVVMVVLARPRDARLVPLLGGLVTALMVLSRILSPQYLVWLLPFVALAWVDGERVATGAFAIASLTTLIVVEKYDAFIGGNRAMALAVVIRNALLVVVCVRFLQVALSPTRARAGPGCAGDRCRCPSPR
jgi:hypothetical protein